ncbi:hypothetical protein SSX86_027762 [Deinandra increscens subsp. villosa]|uniref:HAT C-terminal dimerisation domain-containing protein n=1 Tax=Deinandra increscens subsp. villosa TaxID=3103831 RepID=A0AAP0GJ15_9ASTR
MFTSNEWDGCKLSESVRGKASYATVMSPTFWTGVTSCLKVFAPLVKVLRMVDADWKPSMGFIYGELKKAKEEIKVACVHKKTYEPIMNIISKKMKGRLDTSLHMAAYILNPYYLYNNLEVARDNDAIKGVMDVVGTLYPSDGALQKKIILTEFPIYKGKLESFGHFIAISGCEVNDEKYDPGNWWDMFGVSTPHLKEIAMRILSLTSSSSGCERNWSTFEAVHTKKRNRLEAAKLNNLVYVQFNANLIEKNNKRKPRGREVLLGNDASEAQEWIVDGDVDEFENEFAPGVSYGLINEAMGGDEHLAPRKSARLRELFEDEFESEHEEEDQECESDDGLQRGEQYAQNIDEPHDLSD